MKRLWLTLVVPFFLCGSVLGQPIEPIPAEMATKLATKLVELAGAIAKPQVKITADLEKSNGVHIPERQVGMMVVPQKDLKESEDAAAAMKVEAGAPLGYLFVHRLSPIVDGKLVPADQLHDVSIIDDEGVGHTVRVLLLSVRQLSDEDYRLYAYGKDKKPLVDVKFSEGAGGGSGPVSVSAKDINEDKREGRIVVTVFGKYEASFLAGHAE